MNPEVRCCAFALRLYHDRLSAVALPCNITTQAYEVSAARVLDHNVRSAS